MKLRSSAFIIVAAAALAGCGNTPQRTVNGLPVIATDNDQSVIDQAPLPEGQAAIVYDPDGCQNWIIDDGTEGYASRRRDSATGLPICNGLFPPGTVVNEYRTNDVWEIYPR
jgi:hypothetical protein